MFAAVGGRVVYQAGGGRWPGVRLESEREAYLAAAAAAAAVSRTAARRLIFGG